MVNVFKIFGLVFLISILGISCKSENIAKKPSPFIEKDEFIDIIYDINILEGSLTNLNLNQDMIKDSAMTLYNGVFEKHSIDYPTFKSNQEYYVLTDKYKEVSEIVLERIKEEEIKYKDVTSIKTLSFVQFSQLLEQDGMLPFFNTDTVLNYGQRLDSALNYYRINQYRLESINMDSVSFEVNIRKLRKGRDLFQLKQSVFKPKPTNE